MAAARRVVLVTGAASGIGAATCRALAADSVAIMMHTRANVGGARAVAADIREAGADAAIVLGDLTRHETAGEIVAATVEAFGGLDVLVSNAGFADPTPFEQLGQQGLARSHELIAGAFVRLAQAAIPHLRQGRDPRIVAVSSFVAHAFRTDTTAFAASAAAKAASEALVRVLAVQLGSSGVTVNAVVPGYIRKDEGAHAALDPAAFARAVATVPLGRIGTPAEVAHAIAFLASPAAAYVTGQLLHGKRCGGNG